MVDYRPNEIVDMIMILGESRNNYAIARLYAERYPNRRHVPVMSQFKSSKSLKWNSYSPTPTSSI